MLELTLAGGNVETMTSTQLSVLLGKEKKEVNRNIREMYSEKIDGGKISPSIDSRGYVIDYLLPELESKMFVAKHDINYLEKITQFWIDKKSEQQTPLIDGNFLIKIGEEMKAKDQQINLLTCENENKAIQIEAQAPKVIFADAVATSKSSILVGELAKLIKQNGYNIGQNRLFEWLRDNGYLIRQRGENYNLPTQRGMELKLFEIKKRAIANADGSIRTTTTTKVTGKGSQYFVNKFVGIPGV